MASRHGKPAVDPSSIPLADYFFIAGIESSSIFDNRPSPAVTAPSPRIESTIQEETPPSSSDADDSPVGLSKRFSWEDRGSGNNFLKDLEIVRTKETTSSARSSATIRPTQRQNAAATADNRKTMSEADFEAALSRFANERDAVVSEIQFTPGQSPQQPQQPQQSQQSFPSLAERPPPTQKVKSPRYTNDDLQPKELNGLKSGVGSVRRKLSTINRLQKPGTGKRVSARMSKRVSGYNSVIPAPQRFKADANVHPLKRPFEPVLLDQYPAKDLPDESKSRAPFPDYVPMFVFPNDVNIISSDERPKSTWHGFAMTAADGSKLHGITIIVWIPLKPDAAQELERQCEEWRQFNLSEGERELANSLGERMVLARAKLSELLSSLALAAEDEDERERIQEEISMLEERIALMVEMLRPVRHGAASKIEGLTDGDTGMWMPRAYGILGREGGLTSFWKEWLRVISVPMQNGGVLRVPPSSPRVGIWQPLERYVVTLCAEAISPITSKTQLELSVRELRMYARKEAVNEIPGSRNTDLWPLFRCLDYPLVVTLFEFALAESRIILVSSHTSMLHLASAALVQLLYPFKWQSVFIPVLPARLIQALEAPCPYICGIERRYENVDIPDDDVVLVDLDNGTVEATTAPPLLPRQQRRKLMSILQMAAPHHQSFHVSKGPPKYAQEAFPDGAFATENPTVFKPTPRKSNLAHLANLSSVHFGSNATPDAPRPQPMFNVFSSANQTASQGPDRPGSNRTDSSSLASPVQSPMSGNFPAARNDSSNSLQSSLREKRSMRFDGERRGSGVLSFLRSRRAVLPPADSQLQLAPNRKMSLGNMGRSASGFSGLGHHPNQSVSSVTTDGYGSGSGHHHAPSVYAQSTLAASTVMMPSSMPSHAPSASDKTQWIEGHCMTWAGENPRTICAVCDEKADDGVFHCSGCSTTAHARCLPGISIVCPSAFHADQILAAFIRCFASLLYTYRKHLDAAPRTRSSSTLAPNASAKKHDPRIYHFNRDSFIRSLPHDTADYVATTLSATQAFSEFVFERECIPPSDPAARLFDDVVLLKRARGRPALFSRTASSTSSAPTTTTSGAPTLKAGAPGYFLADTSDHLWRSAAASSSSARPQTASSSLSGNGAGGAGPGMQSPPVPLLGRTPAKLDRSLARAPRVIGGAPRLGAARPRRKMVPVPGVPVPVIGGRDEDTGSSRASSMAAESN